jgi:hypothetical protein
MTKRRGVATAGLNNLILPTCLIACPIRLAEFRMHEQKRDSFLYLEVLAMISLKKLITLGLEPTARTRNKIFWCFGILVLYFMLDYLLPPQPELIVNFEFLMYAVVASVIILVILRTAKISVPSVMKGQPRVKQVTYWAYAIILILLTFLFCGVFLHVPAVFSLLDSSTTEFWNVVFIALTAGIFEEYTTRGLLFDIFHTLTAESRFTLLWSSLGNSAIFASLHLMNIVTSGQDLTATLQQVLYTFHWV